ncbi:MAG: phosphoglucosamine mutase [Candidatus Neomarinimicrobiota bacterium]
MLIQGVSGVRGLFPSDLDAPLARRYAVAFHRFCGAGALVVGRDTRRSGAKLISAILDLFESVGREIRDSGICPTPTVQFTVEDTDAVGGIVVTASHNPGNWNGLKFITGDGCFLNAEEFERLSQLFGENEELEKLSGDELGTYSRFDGAIRRHVDRILAVEWIDVEDIKKRRFSVAVDTINGAASEALPMLLEQLGCRVVRLNCDFSGKFAHPPEPLPSNLVTLSETVKEHHCDVGLATDPDGDRLAVVDERGQPLGDEYTLVLAVDDFLRSTGSSETIVTNLSTTQAVDRVATTYGANVKRSAVGEINVVELMKEVNSPIGGEGNGGVILRDVHLGRDALVAAALVMDRMEKSGEPLSTIFQGFPRYWMVKDKVSVSGVDLDDAFKAISETYFDAEKNTLDGLKLLWPDRWVHIRSSNTEPIVRVYAEAPTRDQAQQLVAEVKENIA